MRWQRRRELISGQFLRHLAVEQLSWVDVSERVLSDICSLCHGCTKPRSKCKISMYRIVFYVLVISEDLGLGLGTTNKLVVWRGVSFFWNFEEGHSSQPVHRSIAPTYFLLFCV